MHKTAYGDDVNQALALPPVGIEASSACENRKCIRWYIRLFRHAAPYRPPIGSGRRNRPDDPASGRDEISTDPPHTSIFVGIVAGLSLQKNPCTPFFGSFDGLSPREAPDGGHRRHRPSVAVYRARGCIAREKEAIRRGLAA